MSTRTRIHWLIPNGGIACGRRRGSFDSDIDNADCLFCRRIWLNGPPAGWKTGDAAREGEQ